jgi:hypothetical protein
MHVVFMRLDNDERWSIKNNNLYRPWTVFSIVQCAIFIYLITENTHSTLVGITNMIQTYRFHVPLDIAYSPQKAGMHFDFMCHENIQIFQPKIIQRIKIKLYYRAEILRMYSTVIILSWRHMNMLLLLVWSLNAQHGLSERAIKEVLNTSRYLVTEYLQAYRRVCIFSNI